jgi:hypothetical protein
MPGTVRLDVDTHQHSSVPFDADVVVIGAPPGATVSATLSETRGRPPLFGPVTNTAVAGGSGQLTLTFSVLLQGPTLAVLLASVSDDQGTFYPSDAERLEVL